MVADAVDYHEWKTGERTEGIVYSSYSFFRKLVIWNVANEPASEEEGANEYSRPLGELARALDQQKRP